VAQQPSHSAREGAFYILVALVGLAAAVPLLGVENWPLELVVSFRLHILIGLVLVALLALLRRFRTLAAAIALIALINAGDVAATFAGSAQLATEESSVEDDARLKVMFANVQAQSQDHIALIAEIERLEPDVVVLAEVTPDWIDGLAGLADTFPYRIEMPRHHPFGMALLSRWPLDDAASGIVQLPSPPTWEGDGAVSIIARIESAAGPVTVVGLHPLPPLLLGGSYSLRNVQMAVMADEIAQLPQPVVAVGDLNMTPWSPTLRHFMDETGLRRPNVAPTWPVRLGWAGLPIDHILLSRDLTFHRIERAGNIGSDHRPLFAVIAIGASQGSPGTP
jgi:endonuclease/exonuclease/phosphatase (EEP) superfamily protein YafD